MTVANGHIQGNETHLPIVIAGGGCVGLFVAHLLARSSIQNRIILIEPEQPDPTSTRAMAHQPLTFPLYARAGLMPELTRHGSFSSGLCFRTGVENGSRLIVGKEFNPGEKAQLLLPQGKFQEILISKIEETGKMDRRLGSHVVGFLDSEDGVQVLIRNEHNEEEIVEALYLIGADGSKSAVRRALGVPFEGITLPNQLVATDIIYDFHAHGFFDANFIVDPEHYGLVGRINQDGLWRVSYGVPDEIPEHVVIDGAQQMISKMLPDGGKSGFEIRRVAPYKAQQLCVEKFWKGSVGLIGDAAHLTNPYAGLGLASGIADASSLAEVLIRILAGQSSDPDKLLASWSEARRQKFLNTIDKPSRMAYARVKNDADTSEAIDALLAKDSLMRSLKEGMPVMPPSIETIGEELDGWI